MSFYLSNPDVHPTGYEPAEFLDIPSDSEHEAGPDRDRDRFGFLRVRLGDDVVGTGYVAAYLVDGTAITVRSADVLRAGDGPTSTDRRTGDGEPG